MHFSSNGFLGTVTLLFLTVVAVAMPVGQGLHATPLPSNSGVTRTVRNVPFSADVVTQYDHLLSNGKVIHRETRGRVFRDAQGRVRTETDVQSSDGVDVVENIAIQDPVLRELIHLDSKTRTAKVHHFADDSAARVGDKTDNPNLLPQAIDVNHGSVVPLGSDTLTSGDIERLGTKSIQGIAVVGTRTSRTTQNRRGDAIIAVTEVWYSPQLQAVVESISDDGESGHIIVRLTNIVHAAPQEELFRVPQDYTVMDGNHIATVIKR